ncbi:hypothetical protein [uncultured Ferrovibrio sp.]|jgi:hypothetical protein|uniref:hypothetical protein n=1 Tax=uncultured Ferrovibrio sp. TaxID=1576913 RepID=UPI00261A2C15|nr:hypothetical protein [uncultured Ferrovibrio sp.]
MQPSIGGGSAGLDIGKTAASLIRHHGRKAAKVAASRANKLAEEGDREGAMEWLRISEAVLAMSKAQNPAS